jgi:hypothetical protein
MRSRWLGGGSNDYELRDVKGNSVVQDNTQEGFVDLKASQLTAILDESQLPEFVHEKIDPGPRCSDHLG